MNKEVNGFSFAENLGKAQLKKLQNDFLRLNYIKFLHYSIAYLIAIKKKQTVPWMGSSKTF
jgi:hypothetical protein